MTASRKPTKIPTGIAALIPGPPESNSPAPTGLVCVTPELLRAAATILDGHGDPRLTETAKTMAQALRDAVSAGSGKPATGSGTAT